MARKHQFDDDLLENLPLPTASFFVLFALAEGEKHGYRIMQDIRELSGSTFSAGPATLYTTIKKLSDQGMISETSEFSEDRRRTYALTPPGDVCSERSFIVNNNYSILHEGRRLLGIGALK